MAPDVFLSVGSTSHPEQTSFIESIEDHLRYNGLTPRALDRTDYFDSGLPLNDTTNLMQQCSGTVVIALERKYIRDGTEKRGTAEQRPIENETICTVWNHIEAVQAHTLGQPVFVIAEQGLHREGVLEDKHEWGIQWVPLDPEVLRDRRFDGALNSWKKKVEQHDQAKQEAVEKQSGAEPGHTDRAAPTPDPSELSIGQLVGILKPAHLRATIVALFGAATAIAVVAYRWYNGLGWTLDKRRRPYPLATRAFALCTHSVPIASLRCVTTLCSQNSCASVLESESKRHYRKLLQASPMPELPYYGCPGIHVMACLKVEMNLS